MLAALKINTAINNSTSVFISWMITALFAVNAVISKPFLGVVRLFIYAFQLPSSSALFKTACFTCFAAIFTSLPALVMITLVTNSSAESASASLLTIPISTTLATLFCVQFVLSVCISLEGDKFTDKTGCFLGTSLLLSGVLGGLLMKSAYLLWGAQESGGHMALSLFAGVYGLFSLLLLLQCWLPLSWKFSERSLSSMTISALFVPLFRHFSFNDSSIVSVILDKKPSRLKDQLLAHINVRQIRLLLLNADAAQKREVVTLCRRANSYQLQRQMLVAAFLDDHMSLAVSIANQFNIKKSWWMEKRCRQWLTIFHGSLDTRIQAAIERLASLDGYSSANKDDEAVAFIVRYCNVTPMDLLPHAPSRFHSAIMKLFG